MVWKPMNCKYEWGGERALFVTTRVERGAIAWAWTFKNLPQSRQRLIAQEIKKAKWLNTDSLNEYLGVRKYNYGRAEETKSGGSSGAGVGMDWVGGDLLTIEAALMPGKGIITRTGSLGDVMKESVEAARTVVRSGQESRLGIKERNVWKAWYSYSCTWRSLHPRMVLALVQRWRQLCFRINRYSLFAVTWPWLVKSLCAAKWLPLVA